MDRKGWGYEELSSTNPGLVLCSISGFGQTGPLRDKPAFDFVAQAYGGVMHMTGAPDGPPTFVGIGIAHTVAAVTALAASSAQRRGGKSVSIRLTLGWSVDK